MLEVCKNQEQSSEPYESKKRDIVIRRYETVTEYDEAGNKITKRVPKFINITKLVNESQKLIKRQSAEQKLAKFEEMQKIFTR